MPTAKKRRLTVSSKWFDRENGSYVCFPSIRLCGKWLQDNGFKAGHIIDITCDNDKITITKSASQQLNTN